VSAQETLLRGNAALLDTRIKPAYDSIPLFRAVRDPVPNPGPTMSAWTARLVVSRRQ